MSAHLLYEQHIPFDLECFMRAIRKHTFGTKCLRMLIDECILKIKYAQGYIFNKSQVVPFEYKMIEN